MYFLKLSLKLVSFGGVGHEMYKFYRFDKLNMQIMWTL